MASDDEDEERFVSYGTPLIKDVAELEEAPKRKPIPVDQQIATDDKGRRRFHGAFTGGFSAGYFNSVDTKEGWAPSTFISSRGSRASKKGQNPEDFMDAEDLGAFGIAPREVRVQKNFTEESNKEENIKKPTTSSIRQSIIPGAPPLKDFIVPTRDSIGVKLLKKMGWKPGQGIGPRLKYEEKKKTKRKTNDDTTEQQSGKIYGCSLPDDFHLPDSSDSEDLELYEGLTFAPDDVTVNYFNAPKENWQGLGYVGLDKNPILGKKNDKIATPLVDKGKKLAISGEAFGVGAFENDDDTIYNDDDMSQYDFELLSGADDVKKDVKAWQKNLSIGYIGKELEGFHISSVPLLAKKIYTPPALPNDFQPIHKCDTNSVETSTDTEINNKQLSTFSRSAAIGELDPNTSVFDFLKPEDKVRLQSIKKSISEKSSKRESSKTTVDKSVEKSSSVKKPEPQISTQPTTPAPLPQVKRQSSESFRPFANNEEKQKRYEIFLHFQEKNQKLEFCKYQPSSLTEWEKQREFEEFQRASQLFKPMAHTMASRFVSSKQTLDESQSSNDEVVPPEGLSKPVIDVGIKRETLEWHPDPVLCKRFNIPNPYPDSKLVGLPKSAKKEKTSIFDMFTVPKFEETTKEKAMIEAPLKTEEAAKSEVTKKVSLFDGLDEKPIPKFTIPSSTEPEPQIIDDESEDDDDEPQERPPIDIFRAIFADSDSEKEEEEEKLEAEISSEQKQESTKIFSLTEMISKNSLTPLMDVSQSSSSKTEKKASGLFANLDLPAPRSSTTGSNSSEELKRLTSVAVKPSETNSGTQAYYGPALPPVSKTSDKPSQHSKRRHEQTYKSHKKRKKEKHNKKKHKRSRKSSEDESESESDKDVKKIELKTMDKQIANKLRGFLNAKR